MPKTDLEQLKRYIRYADHIRQIRRRGMSGSWWMIYGFFWLATLVLLLIWMSDNYETVGPWWTLVVFVAFVIFHILAIWGIQQTSRKLWFRSPEDFETLRYDCDRPAAGQICSAIKLGGTLFGGTEPYEATGAWKTNLRPVFKVLEVNEDQTLNLQLIRSSNPSALGRVFSSIPRHDVEAIES